MKVLKNSGLVVTSSPCNDDSPNSSHQRPKQVKRKQSFDDSLVLLSTAASKVINKSIESDRNAEVDLPTNDDSSSESEFCISPAEMSSESSRESVDFLEGTEEPSLDDLNEKYGVDVKFSFGPKNIKNVRNEVKDDVESESEYRVFHEKKTEFRNQIEQMATKKRKLNEVKQHVRIEPFPTKNKMIVFIDHPGTITLYQYVSVNVISGTVSVYGKDLNPESTGINVLSSENTGLISLETQSSQNLWIKKSYYKSVLQKLMNYVSTKEHAIKLLKNLNPSTVIVALKGRVLKPNLRFLELYSPKVLKFNQEKFGKKSFVSQIGYPSGHIPKFGSNSYCFKDVGAKSVQFNDDHEDLAAEIVDVVCQANSIDNNWPRILVYGPQNTGKSTLLRYLINKVLVLHDNMFYLDGDPGQTEFTPPGVVSLTQVKEAVIGPPFFHPKKPLSMCFTGAISADLSPDMYNHSVNKLMRYFNRMVDTGTLFVNTMGWVKGIGLGCLKNVMKAVKPTIVVEIVNEKDPLMFDYRKYVPAGAKFHQITCPTFKMPKISAEESRSLSILSYFGACQSSLERPTYLNSFIPFCVCWDDIPVYNFKRKLVPYRLIESMNASVVALCKVSLSAILSHPNNMYPKTLESEPDNECIGFGIVRAVDEVRHLLYIVTPLNEKEIISVNAIMKGIVTIPESFILQQPIMTPLYFTNELQMEAPTERDSSFIVDNNDIAIKYRKGIRKRFGKTKKRN